MAEQKFPLYRKTPNEKSFYKISNANSMMEIQVIGSKYLLHELETKIFPEKMLVHDLITNTERHWINIPASEFEEIYQRYKEEKTK